MQERKCRISVKILKFRGTHREKGRAGNRKKERSEGRICLQSRSDLSDFRTSQKGKKIAEVPCHAGEVMSSNPERIFTQMARETQIW